MTVDASPSAWRHRLPIAVLALVGCTIATYLTLYQWHVTDEVWDPFFGPASSAAVLTSPLSRALPLPDATLGALAYLVEFVLTLAGSSQRWRTHPRLVLVYGVVLAGMAVAGLGLLLTQVLLLHAVCSLCIASALISFVIAWLGRTEVLASARYHFRKEPYRESYYAA